MQRPAIFEKESATRLVQGAIAGILATVVIGFNWGGWSLESTAKQTAAKNTSAALVSVLGPICAEKFRRSPNATTDMSELKKVNSWMQDSYIQKGGWSTFDGMSGPDIAIAQECAKLLLATP